MNAHAPASTDSLDSVIAVLRGAPDAARLERFARDFLARLPRDELDSRPAAVIWISNPSPAPYATSIIAVSPRRKLCCRA